MSQVRRKQNLVLFLQDAFAAEPEHEAAPGLACELGQAVEASPEPAYEAEHIESEQHPPTAEFCGLISPIPGQFLSGYVTIWHTPRSSHCSETDHDDFAAEPVHEAVLGFDCESGLAFDTSPDPACEPGHVTDKSIQTPIAAFSTRPKQEISGQFLSRYVTNGHTSRPSHCSESNHDDIAAEPIHLAAVGLACELEAAVDASPEPACEPCHNTNKSVQVQLSTHHEASQANRMKILSSIATQTEPHVSSGYCRLRTEPMQEWYQG
ncbi:hypothetical protein MTO96_048946 [Rhipicephalus appendiculatus]